MPIHSVQCCVLSAVALFSSATLPAAAADGELFQQRIRPLLAEHCFHCHSAQAEKLKAGLHLDSRASMIQGGDSGPAIVPGDPDASLLIKAIRYTNDDLRMPPKKRLSDEQIADLTAWVKAGAQDGSSDAAAPATTANNPEKPAYDFAEWKKWWSFQPIKSPPVPAVKNVRWAKSPIDRFVLEKLEHAGLAPAVIADKRVLIRRATFDLTGLPPTPEEVAAFLNDKSPDAFAKVVDRLLSSPHYGERWGRHWLDVVRYTDSFDARGIGGEADVPEAYRYRDWVVSAFNRDLPFDEFVVHQIAGDLLKPSSAAEGFYPEGIVATGVMAIGEWGTGDADKEKMLTDIVDDQIDVTGRAFLGLTLACARCHDHKFDPIPTEDYYSLAGIYFSSRILPGPGAKTAGSPTLRIPLISQAELDRRKKRESRIVELEKEIERVTDEQLAALARESLDRMPEYIVAAAEVRAAEAEGAVPRDGQQNSFAGSAGAHSLREPILRRWIELLSKSDIAGLFTTATRDVLGKAGLHAWKNPSGDTPSLTVNTTDNDVAFLTIQLPPRTVAVHPSPANGVGVAWKSPVSACVRVRASLADADPNCGNGIDWTLGQRSRNNHESLAKGAFVNGAADETKDAITIQVAPGDAIELVVLPKGDYSCDTTRVELEISEAAGAGRVWSLTRNVAADPLSGNPHADGFGNPNVWHFYDAAGASQGFEAPDGSAFASVLEQFSPATTQRSKPANALRELAEQAHRELSASDPKSKLVEALTSPRGLFWSALRGKTNLFAPDVTASIIGLRSELAGLRSNPPAPVEVAHGLQEGGVPESAHAGIHDVAIHVRGKYDRLGKVVPRRFPRVLAGVDQPPISDGSGRMQLARWIASRDNPLTARVMVNRIWQHHFGEGLVRTPNNFGKLGTPPSHPELLDHLASEFIHSGWSIKAMHRAIMHSAAYQQASINEAGDKARAIDPENKLLWHFPRRRLEAEALRDALLAASGRLDRTVGGKSIRDLNTTRRTLYVMSIRSDRATYQALFDGADPTQIIEKRTESTVAPQALFLLNHPFVTAQIEALAKRVSTEASASDARRIRWLYELLFSRPPSADETRIAELLVRNARDAAASPEADRLAWQQLCHVLICANEFMYID